RRDLAVLAEALYRDHRVPGLKNTGVISAPTWIPAEPVLLDEIMLTLDSVVAEPTITGEEPESGPVRPLATIDARYRRYHDAIRDLARPACSRTGCASACSDSTGPSRACTSGRCVSSTRSTPMRRSPTNSPPTTSRSTATGKPSCRAPPCGG